MPDRSAPQGAVVGAFQYRAPGNEPFAIPWVKQRVTIAPDEIRAHQSGFWDFRMANAHAC
jgi:hypothetical protein